MPIDLDAKSKSDESKLSFCIAIKSGEGSQFRAKFNEISSYKENHVNVLNSFYNRRKKLKPNNVSFEIINPQDIPYYIKNDIEKDEKVNFIMVINQLDLIDWNENRTLLLKIDLENNNIFNENQKDILYIFFKINPNTLKELQYSNHFIERI
jgi:hypothetical protein